MSKGQFSNWYGASRWRKLRAAHLAKEPLCRFCARIGQITEATVVDHIDPHRGDRAKFWKGPFQSLCAPCHNSEKRREELGAAPKGSDLEGWPVSR